MNHCSRKHAYLLLVMALALLLQACASSPVEQPAPEPAKLKVTLAPYLGFAPFFIAEDEGFFAEQGLEIELVEIKHADPRLLLVRTAAQLRPSVELLARLVGELKDNMSRQELIRIMQQMGRVVERHVNDEQALEKIRDGWLAIPL